MALLRRKLKFRPPTENHVTLHNGLVHLDGRPLKFSHKTQAVLLRLVAAAPSPVSRQSLIDAVWLGNYFTGEKGLRQAIWTIRSKLGDDAATPTFIRTLPRQGYCWVGPREIPRRPTRNPSWVAVGALAISLTLGGPGARSLLPPEAALPTPVKIAHASLQGSSVVVDLDTGCRAILQSANGLQPGQPIIAADGSMVAIPVSNGPTCGMVLYEAGKTTLTRFENCVPREGFEGRLPKKTI